MKKILLLFYVTQACFSCMNVAWRNYKRPSEADFADLNISSICMKIGTQNLNDRQKKAILEAAAEVCNIYSSGEFKDSVESHNWLLSCELTENGEPDVMTGLEVYNILQGKINDYSINPRKPWRAIAQTQRDETEKAYNRVAINPKRIESWYSDSDTIKSKLINTIAHETTHIISYHFRDRGHGSDICPNDKLVSYGIGNLVERLWLAKNK